MIMTKEMLVAKPRPKGKYRCVPGYSMSNKELLERVRNRSIVIDSSSQVYSTDPGITGAARKSRVENARDMIDDAKRLFGLDKSIKKDVHDSKIEAARAAGRKEGEASKGGNDGQK